MKKIITEKISKDEIVKKVREVREKEGRLVAINGYVNKEKSNIIVYTLEYDEFRKHYHIEGENILPTITNIYIGAQWFEEEIQEVMPVKFEGLVFSGRLFLPDEFKEGQGQILIMPLNELKKLKNNNWYKYGMKIALGIGDYFDESVLEEFTENKSL